MWQPDESSPAIPSRRPLPTSATNRDSSKQGHLRQHYAPNTVFDQMSRPPTSARWPLFVQRRINSRAAGMPCRVRRDSCPMPLQSFPANRSDSRPVTRPRSATPGAPLNPSYSTVLSDGRRRDRCRSGRAEHPNLHAAGSLCMLRPIPFARRVC